jgi:hypothetical protein
MARDVEIEIAVGIEISEGRSGRPSVEGDARGSGRIFERSIAAIPPQGRTAESGEQNVEVAVRVVIRDCRRRGPPRPSDAARARDFRERRGPLARRRIAKQVDAESDSPRRKRSTDEPEAKRRSVRPSPSKSAAATPSPFTSGM